MKSIWKKAALAVLAGAMAFSFTGCGGEKKAEAPAAKKESKEITVYMGVVEQSAKVVASEFEKDTGIKVNFVRMSGGETLSRIRDGKNQSTGQWYGSAAAQILSLWRKGRLLEAYKSPNAEKIKPEFKDADGYWTGIYQGYLGFILDGRYFDEHKLQPPTSWMIC